MDNEELSKINDNSSSVPVTRNTYSHGEVAKGKNNGYPLWSGWDPFFRDFRRAFVEITDMFERFTKELTGIAALPEADVTRSGGSVAVKVTVPGLNKNNLNVEVYEDYVRLAGKQNRRNEYKNQGGAVYRSEESCSAFFRILPLPVRVRQEEAIIEYNGDTVIITVPEV